MEEQGPKVRPTLQVAAFVASWLISWYTLLYNSSQILFFPDRRFDVVFLAPVLFLLLGLIMTNLMGYLEEKEDPALARAAAVDLDFALLLRRHGRELLAGSRVKPWGRLKARASRNAGLPFLGEGLR